MLPPACRLDVEDALLIITRVVLRASVLGVAPSDGDGGCGLFCAICMLRKRRSGLFDSLVVGDTLLLKLWRGDVRLLLTFSVVDIDAVPAASPVTDIDDSPPASDFAVRLDL